MGEYLAAPALLDEPAVQQSFLSYFNTIVVSPGDGACLSWSVMRALLLMPPCVREHLSCPAQRAKVMRAFAPASAGALHNSQIN